MGDLSVPDSRQGPPRYAQDVSGDFFRVGALT